jgi:hypothetical protein
MDPLTKVQATPSPEAFPLGEITEAQEQSHTDPFSVSEDPSMPIEPSLTVPEESQGSEEAIQENPEELLPQQTKEEKITLPEEATGPIKEADNDIIPDWLKMDGGQSESDRLTPIEEGTSPENETTTPPPVINTEGVELPDWLKNSLEETSTKKEEESPSAPTGGSKKKGKRPKVPLIRTEEKKSSQTPTPASTDIPDWLK